MQCTCGVCLCSPGAQGSALGAPACWVFFFLKAPLADLRGINKSLPHLPGLQMTSHQSTGSQGGPGPLRLPRCPWGLRSSWGAASPPRLIGPKALLKEAVVPEGGVWALAGPLLLFSWVSLFWRVSVAVFKFSDIFF